MDSLANAEQEILGAIRDRLFVFDMDGTLLLGTTACLEIAKASGTLDELHVLERQFASGEIDAFCFAQNIGALWGLLDKQAVRNAFEAAPKLANIEAVTALIRRGGGKSGLITMSPDYYANLFFDYGFDFISASRFPGNSREEVKRENILNPRDKPEIVKAWCKRIGFEFRQCVAFGDSMSDYPLFRELEHTVAMNGDPTLRGLARYQCEGCDLQAAFLSVCRELIKQ